MTAITYHEWEGALFPLASRELGADRLSEFVTHSRQPQLVAFGRYLATLEEAEYRQTLRVMHVSRNPAAAEANGVVLSESERGQAERIWSDVSAISRSLVRQSQSPNEGRANRPRSAEFKRDVLGRLQAEGVAIVRETASGIWVEEDVGSWRVRTILQWDSRLGPMAWQRVAPVDVFDGYHNVVDGYLSLLGLHPGPVYMSLLRKGEEREGAEWVVSLIRRLRRLLSS